VGKLVIKLSKLCFAIKTMKSFVNKNMVKTIYFAYMHSSLKYGILFLGNVRNLKKVFKLQKRAIRLIANISSTTRSKPYLKKLKIMTLPCIYIYGTLLYIKMSFSIFKTNFMFHSHDTRTKIYSLQATTPNYSNRVLRTTVCLFITNCLAKLKVLSQ
jgi:hypothetical protein